MTDAEYIFKTDSSSKKNIARGYHHRKGGKGSSSCKLSSDNLTNAQWKKLNGNVMTINLNTIMPWKDFKRISVEMQTEYLQNLINKFNPRQKDVAFAMEVDPSAFSAYIRRKIPNLEFKNHNQSAPLAWVNFINGKVIEDEADIYVEEEIEEPVEEIVAVTKETYVLNANALHGNLSFVGDPYSVFTRAVKLFDENKRYKITIQYHEEELSC